MRRLLALALILAAGCTTPGSELASTGALLLPPLAFGPAVAMDQPTGGAEPNLAVASDGTLWITAVAGSQERSNHETGAAWLWRSTDEGATWETLRAPMRETPLGSVPMTRRPFGSSDADVVTSPDGWVYYTDWWNWGAPVAGTPRAGNYLVERSSDGGKTWTSASVTTMHGLTGAVDRQWLVAGEDGFVALFYAYFHPVENLPCLGGRFGQLPLCPDVMSIQVVLSEDHGATWSDPVTVVPPEAGTGYQIAHARIAPDGALVMPYGYVKYAKDFWTDPSEVRLARSTDGGRTWTQTTVAQVPGGFDNLWAVQGALDATGAGAGARGHVYVAWAARDVPKDTSGPSRASGTTAARTGETMTLFLSRSADFGESWSEPLVIREEGLNFLPWVAARGDGRVAVGWYGGDALGDPTEASDAATWYAYVATSADGGHTFQSARVADAPVKVGPICPKGAECGASNRELLDYVSLDYTPDGRIAYAFATSREVGGVKAGLVNFALQS